MLKELVQAIKEKHLETIGDAGAFSLDFGKTLTTGEGGIVLTNNKDLFESSLAFHDPWAMNTTQT